jgi:hypothetical protein
MANIVNGQSSIVNGSLVVGDAFLWQAVVTSNAQYSILKSVLIIGYALKN